VVAVHNIIQVNIVVHSYDAEETKSRVQDSGEKSSKPTGWLWRGGLGLQRRDDVVTHSVEVVQNITHQNNHRSQLMMIR
jgi:hypothetical protein